MDVRPELTLIENKTEKNNGKKPNIVRRLYDWVLSWAEKPSAQYALFILAFAESSFFIVPPDILLIPLVLGYRKKWFRLAVIVTAGSVLGGMFGYFIGHLLWWKGGYPHYSAIASFFFDSIPGFSEAVFESMKVKYDLYGFWIVFTAGFTPIPYKIFTISSGAFDLNFVTFLIASVVSRGARFFLVAFLINLFGEPMKKFIDKYFNWLALVFTVLLIGGFLLIKGMI
jgi:membrane protein YqaA with SNARE-associated domain